MLSRSIFTSPTAQSARFRSWSTITPCAPRRTSTPSDRASVPMPTALLKRLHATATNASTRNVLKMTTVGSPGGNNVKYAIASAYSVLTIHYIIINNAIAEMFEAKFQKKCSAGDVKGSKFREIASRNSFKLSDSRTIGIQNSLIAVVI